jgi:DNA-directed RNA polymerase specialized sigma24 family protein
VGKDPDPRFTPADAAIVKSKARGVLGRFGFRVSDLEDLEQELATQVFQKTCLHDPERGSREAFVGAVAANKLLNLVQIRTARKRGDRRNFAYADAPDPALIDGTVTQTQIDLQLEMREMATSLPPDVREVYELMLQGYGEVDIQKHLHLSRQRVRTFMGKVEARLRETNLGIYVGRATKPHPNPCRDK